MAALSLEVTEVSRLGGRRYTGVILGRQLLESLFITASK